MYNVRLLPLAEQDIKEAARWYNSKQINLGKKFTFEVRRTTAYLKANPLACAVRFDSVRTALLKVFPYMIHYLVNEREKEIIIIGVLHMSRNPETWRQGKDDTNL